MITDEHIGEAIKAVLAQSVLNSEDNFDETMSKFDIDAEAAMNFFVSVQKEGSSASSTMTFAFCVGVIAARKERSE